MSWKSLFAAAGLSCSLASTVLAKPADLPVDQRINLAGDALPGDDNQPTTPDSERAVEIFERAERHRKSGQLFDARRAYEEVHLMSPTSRVGRAAIQRLRDLETPGNDFSEEQEPPLIRSSAYQPSAQPPRREVNRVKRDRSEYEDMLRGTQPLDVAPDRRESY